MKIADTDKRKSLKKERTRSPLSDVFQSEMIGLMDPSSDRATPANRWAEIKEQDVDLTRTVNYRRTHLSAT